MGVYPRRRNGRYRRHDKNGRAGPAGAATIYAGITRAQQKRGIKCQQYGVHTLARPLHATRQRARMSKLNRLRPEGRMAGLADRARIRS